MSQLDGRPKSLKKTMVTEGNLLVGQNSCIKYEIRQQLLMKHSVSNKYNKIFVRITELSGRLLLV